MAPVTSKAAAEMLQRVFRPELKTGDVRLYHLDGKGALTKGFALNDEVLLGHAITPFGHRPSSLPVRSVPRPDTVARAGHGTWSKLASSPTEHAALHTFVIDPGELFVDAVSGAQLEIIRKRDHHKWLAPLQLQPDGTLQADAELHSSEDYEWRVVDATGSPLLNLEAPAAPVDKTMTVHRAAPSRLHEMGAHRVGDAVTFGLWAPDATAVTVSIRLGSSRILRIPMSRNEHGDWRAEAQGAWQALVGKPYLYEMVTTTGKTLTRADPYARSTQGTQRGISRAWFHPKTGAEVDPFYVEPSLESQLKSKHHGLAWELIPQKERDLVLAQSRQEFFRFEVQQQPDADRVTLTFKGIDRDSGKLRILSAQELLNHVGAFDSEMNPDAKTKLRGGRYNDLWSENLNPDGSIELLDEEGAWTTFVNNPERLFGLRYELNVWKKDATGRLVRVEDTNGNARVSPRERLRSGHNDPWTDEITLESGQNSRASMITDTAFAWKNDAAERARDPGDWRVLQLHVGSFLGSGQNSNRSTFKDLVGKLDFVRDTLGFNTLELLPTGELETLRDWGYVGAHTLAVAEAYGFIDSEGEWGAKGRWVCGYEAMKIAVDAAHGAGLNVVGDVVYNHIGCVSNPLKDYDGDQDPYTNWSDEADEHRLIETPWGSLPAFQRDEVQQFFVDHALFHQTELHLDGLRVDYTDAIKGDNFGGVHGWNLLRRINATLRAVDPNFVTIAEQFPLEQAMIKPLEDGGAGFNFLWNNQVHHWAVGFHDIDGAIKAVAAGKRPDLDRLMTELVNMDAQHSLGLANCHDEVGNGEYPVTTARRAEREGRLSDWVRGAVRFNAGIGMFSRAAPLFFQGDESLASNSFKWGRPSTWDLGWGWHETAKKSGWDAWDWSKITFNDAQENLYKSLLHGDAPLTQGAYLRLNDADKKVFKFIESLPAAERTQAMHDMHRWQNMLFFQDASRLRRDSGGVLSPRAHIKSHLVHNKRGILAYTMHSEGREYFVLGGIGRTGPRKFGLDLPHGEWRELLNSDALKYGGGGLTNGAERPVAERPIISGRARLRVAAGSIMVFEKVN